MNTDPTKYPDLDQLPPELQQGPWAPIRISAEAAFAIITHVQLAIKAMPPDRKDNTTSLIAIDTARQLQRLFLPESRFYKDLENIWMSLSIKDIYFPEDPDVELVDGFYFGPICDEPCEELIRNLGCRCTEYEVFTKFLFDGHKLGKRRPRDCHSPDAVAAMEKNTRSLECEGYEVVVDM